MDFVGPMNGFCEGDGNSFEIDNHQNVNFQTAADAFGFTVEDSEASFFAASEHYINNGEYYNNQYEEKFDAKKDLLQAFLTTNIETKTKTNSNQFDFETISSLQPPIYESSIPKLQDNSQEYLHQNNQSGFGSVQKRRVVLAAGNNGDSNSADLAKRYKYHQ